MTYNEKRDINSKIEDAKDILWYLAKRLIDVDGSEKAFSKLMDANEILSKAMLAVNRMK